MKILIYTHAFAPQIGGSETYVMLLAEGLAARRQGVEPEHAVTVATATPAGAMEDTVLPFRVVRRPGILSLYELIQQADILHLAGPCVLPLLLGVLLGKRVSIEHHGYQASCPNGLLLFEPTKTVCPDHFMQGRYRKCLECNASALGFLGSVKSLLVAFLRRWGSRRASANFPITRHVDKRLQLPRSKVIYYGIPDVAADSVTPRQPATAATVTFAYVGRLVSEKGLPLLVEAAHRLEPSYGDFQMMFVGDGPERSRLEAKVKEWNLERRVTFTGYLRGEALESALADVTAVVMPSIWEETAGLSAIEHMMRGRLVIAADIGGLGEIVEGVGLKFPCGDVEGLCSCLSKVIAQPELRKSLGAQARAHAAELFRKDRMVAEHLESFRQLAPAAAFGKVTGVSLELLVILWIVIINCMYYLQMQQHLLPRLGHWVHRWK